MQPANPRILTINGGSSSNKFALFETGDSLRRILEGGYVVPADDKENARLIVSQIILDALNGLEMAYPKTTAKRRRELNSIRQLLAK